ncbi:MAG: PLP-dependent aminotransferase family protein [Roseomonas sp.]|nr:PLP-dependent aminotransferase family protein [Roseomonas sp.]MCA3327683.1 PLP-dependent aminotransferase family protein [Roseomonas sp.]MCA3330692.1 PLP-dependent aminotransferase family protein [Roseomonas sp.]MCA3334181.1 PLP-dependent aminotransferase family protein [Roseomonas sp.]MCA3346723.1 PLP-dependent aminotransferase family protein [Roseomonas sp.]
MSRPLRKAPGAEAALLSLALDRRAKLPLHVQLAEGLRRLILSGRIAPGARLPSTRALAAEYGIARATAVLAVEQLAAEGYVTARRGSGLYASATLPEGNLQPARPDTPAAPAPAPPTAPWQPFQIEATDPALFPRQTLGRLLQRHWRLDAAGLLAPQDGFGLFALRAALAEHLRAWRGITAEPAHIIITSGFFDGLDIIAAAAFKHSDAVLIEEPGFPPLRHALQRLALRPIPGLADQAGLDPAALDQALRGVFMAPSRHYPLGGTLSLSRRLAFLEWAERAGGFLVEDDYDGEYRYAGAPLPALMSLDRAARVIYVGSFSKVLSRSMRLGYVVLPGPLVAPARAHLARRGLAASILPQAALAEFIASGDFAAHIRRTRRVYGRRLAAMQEAMAPLAPYLKPEPTDAGLHLVASLGPRLKGRVTDQAIAAAAAVEGVHLAPLFPLYAGPPRAQGLLLGFAGFSEATIQAAMQRLGLVLARLAKG